MDTYKDDLQKAITLLEKVNFNRKHPWPLNLVALYCSILEFSDSIIKLVENKRNISIPVVLRGLLEAYVDLKNLSEDKNYGYNMEASHLKEWLRILKEAKRNGQNPYLDSIGSNHNLPNLIKMEEGKLFKLKQNGYLPLNVKERFKKADMIEEYSSIYNVLCSHTHNNIRSLRERFFVLNQNEDDFSVNLFRQYDKNELEPYIQTGALILKRASQHIHATLKTGFENEFLI